MSVFRILHAATLMGMLVSLGQVKGQALSQVEMVTEISEAMRRRLEAKEPRGLTYESSLVMTQIPAHLTAVYSRDGVSEGKQVLFKGLVAASKAGRIRQIHDADGSRSDVSGVNSEYAFVISRRSLIPAYTVNFLYQLGTNARSDEAVARVAASVTPLLFPSECFLQFPIPELLSGAGVRVKSVSERASKADRIWRVEFEADVSGSSARVFQDAWLHVEADEDHRLLGYGATEMVGGASRKHVATFEYADSANRLLPSRIVERSGDGTSTDPTIQSERTAIRYMKVVPKELFHLTHYGLTEPFFGRSYSWFWICLLVGGLALLAMYWRLARRKRQRLC